MSIYKCLFDFPSERMSFQRAPLAFAENTIFGYRPFRIRTNEYQIGLITGTDKTSIVYFVNLCGRMAHLFHYLLDGEYSFVYQPEHTDQ